MAFLSLPFMSNLFFSGLSKQARAKVKRWHLLLSLPT
jgi:hypothetical protein